MNRLIDLVRRRQQQRWDAVLRAIDLGADPRTVMSDGERRQLRSAIHRELARRGIPDGCKEDPYRAYR